jgi:glyoxylase-like metal-dependent hydrolase (beta-lactamase superfamily II)
MVIAPILAARPYAIPHRSEHPSDLGVDHSHLAPPPALRPLTDGEVIEGPGYRLEVVATPGHASDHLAFAFLGRDLIFSGDHVMGWSTTVIAPPDGSMAEYMRSLERLLSRPEQFYLPAHGGEIRDAHAHVRALKAHRRMRERAILESLKRGDRTVSDIVRRTYEGLDLSLAGAAELSIFAHLQDLVSRGLAAADGQPSLSGTYRPADTTADPPAPSPPG